MMRVLLFVLMASVAMYAAAIGAVPPTSPTSAAAPAGPASAAPPASAPTSPYATIVPVAGTSRSQRNAAFRAALTVVLQRMAPGSSAGASVLAKAANYVVAYHYRPASSGNGLALEVEFDPGTLQRLVVANANTSGGAGGAGVAASATSGSPSSAAPVTASASGTLWVQGVDSSRAFASMLAALRNDRALHDVTPVAAQGDGVLVHLRSDRPLASALGDLTGPGGHLASARQSHPGADMTLRWVP